MKAFGQVSTVIEPPALVSVVKQAGLGDAILIECVPDTRIDTRALPGWG